MHVGLLFSMSSLARRRVLKSVAIPIGGLLTGCTRLPHFGENTSSTEINGIFVCNTTTEQKEGSITITHKQDSNEVMSEGFIFASHEAASSPTEPACISFSKPVGMSGLYQIKISIKPNTSKIYQWELPTSTGSQEQREYGFRVYLDSNKIRISCVPSNCITEK